MEMLRKSLEWRKAVKFEEATTWKIPPEVQHAFPYFIDGLDKDGRIVFYFPIGRWEVRKMLANGYKTEMEKLIYSSMANLLKTIDDTAHEQFLIIIDLAGLTYWKVAHFETMQMVLQVFREYEQNFPERLDKALVINSPWVLNCIFPMVKPLLTGTTLQKVQIFDSCADKYLPAILDIIPISGLPSGFQEYNREIIQAQIITTN
ncbi:sec14 cytosolic factor isoform X2 [Folsomia candida]|nr:sec14 cytosolic factor isoform X2 [Folsomia candida]XP_035701652.1 sec14 cytosolic factor isoform X2 [Folsomia candida]